MSKDDSIIDNLINVDEKGNLFVWDNGGLFNSRKKLTIEQLKEIVSIYNAWRVGNLEDCSFDSRNMQIRR